MTINDRPTFAVDYNLSQITAQIKTNSIAVVNMLRKLETIDPNKRAFGEVADDLLNIIGVLQDHLELVAESLED